jgi:uncharacterized membrane protein
VDDLEPGTGWVLFAGVMLLLVGAWNIIDGIAALAGSDYLVNRLAFSNLHAWGWFFLIWGIVQCGVALAIWAGRGWAAVIGVISACGNIVGQLLWARTLPVWAIAIIVADVLVIYGLVVYGGDRGED